jgi:type II secretory pathway component GspD/PulD (secretin)
MSVTPSVTEREGDTASGAHGGVREADTVVRVRGGDTVVISGMLRRRGATKTDLVLLLTPTLVTPGGAAPEAAQR